MADPYADIAAPAPAADPYAGIASPVAKPKVGTLQAGLEGVGQGLTFGTSDEIEGAARAVYNKLIGGDTRPIGDLYNEAVAIPRARQAAAAEDHPVAYHAGEVGSAVALPGGLARLGVKGAMAGAAGAGLGARTVAAAKEAAAYGAAYGAGKAEGGPEARIAGALSGGLTSGAMGAAVPGAVDLGGAVLRRVAAPIKAAIRPEGMAAEKFAEAAARDLSRVDNAPGASMERLGDRFDTMSAVSPAVRVMDTGGENVQGLMRAAGNMPNQMRAQAKRVVDARQGNQHTRIKEGLTDTLGENRNFYDTLDQVVADRAAKARPAFRESYEAPFDVKASSDFGQFLGNRKYMQRMLEKTAENVEGTTGENLAEMRPWELLHRVRMQMRREIENLGKGQPDSVANWSANDLRKLRGEFDGYIATHNPKLGGAIKDYAESSALKEALETGKDEFFKLAPEQIKKRLADMSSDEASFWRLGAARSIVDRMAKPNANRDRTDSLFASPDMQARLEQLFPTRRQLREFQKQLVIEAKMADSRKALQGNSTTAKQLAEGDQAGKPSRMITSAMNMLSGHVVEPVLHAVESGYNRFSGLTPAVANEILRLGLSKDPALIRRLAAEADERAAASIGRRAAVAQRALPAVGMAQTVPSRERRGLAYPPQF